MTKRGNFILEGQIKQHSNSATKKFLKQKYGKEYPDQLIQLKKSLKMQNKILK